MIMICFICTNIWSLVKEVGRWTSCVSCPCHDACQPKLLVLWNAWPTHSGAWFEKRSHVRMCRAVGVSGGTIRLPDLSRRSGHVGVSGDVRMYMRATEMSSARDLEGLRERRMTACEYVWVWVTKKRRREGASGSKQEVRRRKWKAVRAWKVLIQNRTFIGGRTLQYRGSSRNGIWKYKTARKRPYLVWGNEMTWR